MKKEKIDFKFYIDGKEVSILNIVDDNEFVFKVKNKEDFKYFQEFDNKNSIQTSSLLDLHFDTRIGCTFTVNKDKSINCRYENVIKNNVAVYTKSESKLFIKDDRKYLYDGKTVRILELAEINIVVQNINDETDIFTVKPFETDFIEI